MDQNLCWCGSGKKYDDCHREIEKKLSLFGLQGYEVPDRSLIKTPAQIAGIRRAGALNTAVLDHVAERICVGMSTEDINKMVHEFTVSHGGIPATLGYGGFPKSVCTSVNDQVCHGIPSATDILRSGDIVNVDVTTIYEGYYADASRMFIMGKARKDAQDLSGITRECLRRGMAAAQAWGFTGDIGAAIASFAHKHGYSVVTDFGGHGVGVEFHEEPFICHESRRKTGMLLVPGMVFTIEPMINAGRGDVYVDETNGWTVYTEDGSLSAQWEHTILITENGPEILSD